MSILGDDEIIPWILDKFARHGWWGAKHTNIDILNQISISDFQIGVLSQLVEDS